MLIQSLEQKTKLALTTVLLTLVSLNQLNQTEHSQPLKVTQATKLSQIRKVFMTSLLQVSSNFQTLFHKFNKRTSKEVFFL